MAIEWDEIAGKWQQLGDEVKKQWGKLTDDELTEINGNRMILSGKIQEKYSIAKKYADVQIDRWAEKVKNLSHMAEQKVNHDMQDTIIAYATSEIDKTPPTLGQIMVYAGDKIPTGFLPCDGRMLRRKNHPDLFKVIKTKYGDADGSNTAFNLPLMTSETQGVYYIICVESPKQKNT